MGSTAVLALAAATATLPFNIAFTGGSCYKCGAERLGAIQFSDGAVFWAQGFTPPGGAGEGEWTLLTSRDGGRSWRELRKSWSHNIETRASFGEPRDGWIAIPNGGPDAESYYASTVDGGRRWLPIHVPSGFVIRVLYRGDGRGAAFANDQYAGKSTFFVTRDNGRHWRSNPIDGNLWIDQFAFSGPDAPVLAGCADDQTAILASRDGGGHWSRTTIPQVSSSPQTPGCEAGVDGLVFPKGKPGFALVQRHSFPLTPADGYASIWRTRDGGAHWTRVFFELHPADGPEAQWFTGPYALGDLTLVFVSTATGGSVLYSRNDGESWSRAPLPAALSGCFAERDSLTCTVGSKAFQIATLTIRAAARPPH
jgi:photosystem II stability/assembly factor-like uncharacterized protein